MSLLTELKAQLESGLRPDISAEMLERIVAALEAGEEMARCHSLTTLMKWREATQ